MFKYFLDSNLISSNQSGFNPGGSCINQLIAITHSIFEGFDDRLEIRGVFIDISIYRYTKAYINISIYLKISAKYGMRPLFINYVAIVFVEKFIRKDRHNQYY